MTSKRKGRKQEKTSKYEEKARYMKEIWKERGEDEEGGEKILE